MVTFSGQDELIQPLNSLLKNLVSFLPSALPPQCVGFSSEAGCSRGPKMAATILASGKDDRPPSYELL